MAISAVEACFDAFVQAGLARNLLEPAELDQLAGTIAASDALRSLELTEQVAAATLIAANQGVWLRQRQPAARALPAPIAVMHEALGADFPPLIEDRALEGELRLCLQRIRAQHWGLYA